MAVVTVIAALAIGYLLGSVLPADLLASARGIDIRAVGTGNPGTTNAWEQIGPVAGVATAVFDVSKGLLAMGIASLLGVSTLWAYAAGLAAVFGHRYPIWFHFRGGEGTATSMGLALYTLGLCLASGWVASTTFAVIVAIGAIVFLVSRHGSMVGAVVLPLVVAAILIGAAPASLKALGLFTWGFVWVAQLRRQLQKRRTHRDDQTIYAPRRS